MHRLMSNPLSAALVAWALIAGVARGQSVTPPVMAAPPDRAVVTPLVRAGEARPAPGGWILRENAAGRALQLGFSPAAEALLQELLESPETPAGEKNHLVL